MDDLVYGVCGGVDVHGVLGGHERRHLAAAVELVAMYRAVTFAALDRGIDLDDEAAIDALAEQIEIRFTNGTGEDTRLTIDGQDASAAIRTPQVDANVSKVSAYPGV